MENSQSDPSQIIDMEELMEIMDDDKELIKECFDDFTVDSPEMLEKIRSAIVENNAENLGKAAHAIKGSLKYLAAQAAAGIAYQLEKMGVNNNLEKAMESYESLLEECDKLKKFMSDYEA